MKEGLLCQVCCALIAENSPFTNLLLGGNAQNVDLLQQFRRIRAKAVKGSYVLSAKGIWFSTMYAKIAGQYILKEKLQRGNEFMTKEQKDKCHAIIHTASAAAGAVGAGLAQIPAGDNALLTPIQLTMTISLGKVFDIYLTESAALALATTVAVHRIGRAVSQFLIGWIPGIGNAINATTAAALTESMGWMLAEQFSKEANA